MLMRPQMRMFGGGPVNDPNYKYTKHQINSNSTTYKIPSDADAAYELPSHPNLNERLHAWIYARWAVDRDDVLDNTKVNKYSAYHFFATYSA